MGAAGGETNVLGRLIAAIGLVLALTLRAAGAADDYPTRPVTIVVPLAPGGPADFVARALASAMSKDKTFIVENFSGGGGTVGTRRVVNARPDG